jgi:putative ABC transport system permease protein
MIPADSTLAERLYSILLRAYPPRVRARFSTGMTYAFCRELDAASLRGRHALLGFWVTTIVTTVWFGISARLERVPQINSAATSGDRTMRHLFTIDWRDAWRSLRATPIVTAIAVLSLALGIGANTALFSILNSLILKSLPVREPEQLVLLDGGWTNPIWEQVRDRDRELAAGAFAWSEDSFDLSQGGPTDLVDGFWASGRMFEILGVSTVLGRTLTPADDTRGGGKDGAVAVISYGFWQRRFGGAADVIGRSITIQRQPFTIVGVTEPAFFGPEVGRSFDVAIPIGADPLIRGAETWLDARSTWWLNIMARLEPGQSVEQATARLRAVQPQIREATIPLNWKSEDQADYLKEPLSFLPAATGLSSLRRKYEQPLTAILIVVGLVLLIACANIANLLLARAIARRHELSVRLALGASRLRLVRQLLAESVMLSAAGAVLGLAFAGWGSRILVGQLATANDTVFLDLALDWRVLGFTMAVAAVTATLFGLAPAVGVSGVAPNEALKEKGRGMNYERRLGVRNALVVVQVALSLTLVVAAGLFARTFYSLSMRDAGFEPDSVLVVNANVLTSTSGPKPEARRRELYEEFRHAAATVPGISQVAASFTSPLAGWGWNTGVVVPGIVGPTGMQRLSWVNAVSHGWFATYGVRLVAGRDVDPRDRMGAPRVAIVNRAFAKRFFNSENPIGRQFVTEEPSGLSEPYEVIGLTEDAVYRSLRAEMMPTMYIPIEQWDDPAPGVTIGVRSARGAPMHLVRELADAIGRVDPRAALTFRPLSDQVAGTLLQERLVARLSIFFGGLALLLAALGLYGVTSYAVSRRRIEIGIRMALGAHPASVVRLVLGRVAWLVALGVATGAGLSLWASRFVRALLYDLEPRDPVTFIAAAIVLGLIGLLAGWLPARRAARIDPTVVLREG